MKNTLIYNGISQQMLANNDDGTNRLFINGTEIPSSSWVGSGYYTQTIEGHTITIEKIASLDGNVMLQQTSDDSYTLVELNNPGLGNYIVWKG